jgi:hypothetical protein
MVKTLGLAILSASLLGAQSPDLSGLWKSDLQKSKIAGPPIKEYLLSVEQKEGMFNRRTGEKAPQITETSETIGEHGEHRSELTFFINGKPTVRPFEGVPAELTGSVEGDTILLNGAMAGEPSTFKRTYELSSDGRTLTINMVSTDNGKERQSRYVLSKQPESAAELFRKPEETAEQHFKNVKTGLKTLPQSQFIDQMRYIAWSLDKNCEFCHVRTDFSLDDKKEKKTARKMIDMAIAIDRDNFEGHPAVRCFTCHQKHAHPLSYPLFPDQIAEQKAMENAPPPSPNPSAPK